MQVTTIGLDLAKNVFQVHGITKDDEVAFNRPLRRAQLLPFFSKIEPCPIGIEACSSAHHWARELTKFGHDVRLIPPIYVKPYVKRGKSDAIDAEAICEAVTRPTMRFVAIKTVEQQALLSLHRARSLLVQQSRVEVKEGSTVIARRNFNGGYGFEFPEFSDVEFTHTYNPALLKPAEVEGEEPDKGPNLWNIFFNRLPKFVYYSNYGNLDDQIYLPHVVANMARDDLGQREAAKARTLKVLFDLVNLSAEEMLELARSTGVVERVNQQGQRVGDVTTKTDDEIQEDDKQLRERLALLQSASSKLTKNFSDWWKQGDYKFRLVADGNYFRILVADGLRLDEIELENRSAGLQWFLSFFLVFTYESEDAHEEAIVLLDEPGHSLHPLAQRDLTAFFNNLAKTNQLIFTTHSPFMIDADRLDRVRKVFVGEDGSTEASSDLGLTKGAKGLKDRGATYAVHSALNLTVAESLLLGSGPIN